MEFDKILQKCGDAGAYQYLILGMLGYIGVTSTVHYYSQNVISFVPAHWCYHEQLENRSYAEIAEIYRPFGRLASCTRLESIVGENVTVSSASCERWIYKYDFGFRSMNAELNWVCDNAFKARIGQSLFFVGSLLGTLTFGMLGDRLGRVPALIMANLCGFIGDFTTTYASNLVHFAIFRFISGLAADANFYLMFILVLEYISPKMRNVAFNTTLGFCFFLGAQSASWLPVLLGNWRIYLMCTALTSLCVALFYLVVQESAQWLITRNDIDGAVQRLKYIAHFNGREVSDADFDSFQNHCMEKLYMERQQNVRLFHMLRTPRLRRTACTVMLTFMLQSLSFNTITRNVEGLGLSPFVVFSLFALTIPPASISQGLLQRTLGRKATALFSMLLTALLSCVMAAILSYCDPAQNFVLLLAVSLPMRFGVSMCYTGGSQFSSELLPTCVRSRGLAAAHVSGSAASFLSPYIIHLGTKFPAAPSLILTVVLLVDALFTLMLPETVNKQLPITLEDGEAFGKGDAILTFECLKPKDADQNESKEELNLLERNGNRRKTEA